MILERSEYLFSFEYFMIAIVLLQSSRKSTDFFIRRRPKQTCFPEIYLFSLGDMVVNSLPELGSSLSFEFFNLSVGIPHNGDVFRIDMSIANYAAFAVRTSIQVAGVELQNVYSIV